MLRFVHLTFSSQSHISIITFCRGPVRGRPTSLSIFLAFSLFRSPSALFLFHLPPHSVSLTASVFSELQLVSLPRQRFPPSLSFSLPVASSSLLDLYSQYVPRHHRLESGKFLMVYYGAPCMPTGFIPAQHADKPPPPSCQELVLTYT